MKHYGIEMEGKLTLQKSSLPVWAASDEGRIIYDTTNDIMYIGGSATWIKMADDADIQALGTMSAQDADSVSISGGIMKLDYGTYINEFSTDGTMAGDSDAAVPTEKAVRTYYDAISFPSSTSMLFTQSSAPVGWTRDEVYSHGSQKKTLMLAPDAASIAQGGSYDLVGRSLSHTHTSVAHAHKWYDFISGATDRSHNSAGSSINFTAGGVVTGISMNLGLNGYSMTQDYYTSTATPTINSAGGSLDPRYLTVIMATKD